MRFVLDARYAGRGASGIGNYVRALAARLPELGKDARFRFWIAPGSAALSAAPNVVHHPVASIPAGLMTLLMTPSFDALEPNDVLHLPANILGFRVRCRTLVTVHDLMWLEHTALCQPNPWLRPISKTYYGLGIKNALQHADRICTVSHASADAILRMLPSARSRIFVTPNACEPHFKPPRTRELAAERAREILGFEQPYFLVVGQNQPSKGHDLALKAFAGLELPNHRLVFVQRLLPGRGLERLARELGVADRVLFRQADSLEDLVVLMQAAEALLQPSLAEGFGLPALEAAACGCAVIASDIPPLREVLGKSGYFCEAGSISALGAAIAHIVRDPALAGELRAAGPERARAFDWDATAALTWQIYSDLAARSG